MKHLFILTLLSHSVFSACNNGKEGNNNEKASTSKKETKSSSGGSHWKGTFSNGMKGNKISFDVEGNEVKELTFEGHWHCEGKLDLTTLGPEENFIIEDNKVDGVVTEPKNGAAPFRYELHGTFDGDKAEGTLRISNVQAGCDTYKLNWTAEKE